MIRKLRRQGYAFIACGLLLLKACSVSAKQNTPFFPRPSPRLAFITTVRGGSFAGIPLDREENRFEEDLQEIVDAQLEGALGAMLNETSDGESTEFDAADDCTFDSSCPYEEPAPRLQIKKRHASDLIYDLLDKSLSSDSLELRQLITQRTDDYIYQLLDQESDKLPDPKKLLHFLAPKIPAIKHSPDIALRIQAARSDIDPGVAASLIGVLGHVCERYDKKRRDMAELDDNREYEPIAVQLAKDRRLEQLLECILCGVDVKQRTEEFARHSHDHEAMPDSIEDILDTENVQATRGLSIRDASRAAWGISMLGLHDLKGIGDEKIDDLLIALSLRVRELLLARLQSLRQDDLAWMEGGSEQDTLDILSDELARDTASIVWVFACVRAYTGIRFAPLFEVCCSILCQDPYELRRRAQELDAVIKMGNIGTNDAVERLARSDNVVAMDSSTCAETATYALHHRSSVKHSLTDWLCPKELTDVLWALAIHGRSDTVTQEEAALSETTTAFREVAFDRLLVWLKPELEMKMQELALLEQSSSACSEALPEETIVLEQNFNNATEAVEGSVKVVDAASLLQSEKEALRTTERIDERLLGDITSQPDSLLVTDTADSIDVPAIDELVVDSSSIITPPADAGKPSFIFSSHDLCSIVWAATELQDSSRGTVIEMIAEIFAHSGTHGLQGLSMGDLSNLAWGIAKTAIEKKFADCDGLLALSSSIARAAIPVATEQFDDSLEFAAGSFRQGFQPPELSRLVWATVAIYIQAQSSDCDDIADTMQRLCRVALSAVAGQLHIYGAEDVTRILWCYLEVFGSNGFTGEASEAIGRSLATVETALHQWESCSEMSTIGDGALQSKKQPLNFGSFFGKSTTMLSDYHRLEQESADDVDGIAAVTKKPRPLLKDLPVDPSTLCKLLCSLAKLSSNNLWLKGGESLMRIALRILSSKNGRLLRECALFDLARLCGALVESDMSITGRERVSHFVRRLVQFFNEAPAGYDHAIAPAESAKLLWSLGELGAKCNPKRCDVDIAHRRLELVASVAFLKPDQYGELTDRRVAKLLRGIVTTNMLAYEREYANKIILYTISRVQSSCRSGTVLCDLTETLTLLKEAVSDALETDSAFANNGTSHDHKVMGVEGDMTVTDWSDLTASTEKLIDAVAKQTLVILHNMTAVELRRLLTAYAFAPIHADDVVTEIEKLTNERRIRLTKALKNGAEWEGLTDVFKQTRQVRKALNCDSGSASPSISSTLKSFFRLSKTEPEVIESPSEMQGQEMAESIESVLQSIDVTNHCLQELASSSGISCIKTIDDILQVTLFELGRCTELIGHYRRIDFTSGRHTHRIDRRFQRDMTKRLLSRGLP